MVLRDQSCYEMVCFLASCDPGNRSVGLAAFLGRDGWIDIDAHASLGISHHCVTDMQRYQ
jgi:hypothetical protein